MLSSRQYDLRILDFPLRHVIIIFQSIKLDPRPFSPRSTLQTMKSEQAEHLPSVEGLGGVCTAIALVVGPILLHLGPMKLELYPIMSPTMRLVVYAAVLLFAWKKTEQFRCSVAPYLLWRGLNGLALASIGCSAQIFADIRKGKLSYSWFCNNGRWAHPRELGSQESNIHSIDLIRLVELLDTTLAVAVLKSQRGSTEARAVCSRLLRVLADLCYEKRWEDPVTKIKWTWCRDWVLRCLRPSVFEALIVEGLLPVDALSDPPHLNRGKLDALIEAVGDGDGCGDFAVQSGTFIDGVKFLSAQSLAMCCVLGNRPDLLKILAKQGATLDHPIPGKDLISHPAPTTHIIMARLGAGAVNVAARAMDAYAGNTCLQTALKEGGSDCRKSH